MDSKTQKQHFAQKLAAAMQAKGYEARASTLEREFNLRHYGKDITLHGAAKWLRGEAVPRNDKIATLAAWLEVPPSELVFGLEIDEKIASRKQRWEESIGYQERELFELFLNLPAAQRKVVREVIVAFARAYSIDDV